MGRFIRSATGKFGPGAVGQIVDPARRHADSRAARPVLVVFSGLPGTGKTIVARALALRERAIYLRIDTIETAMKNVGAERIGPAGYAVANAVAVDNLLMGHWVVADCVNPVRASRAGWRAVAARAAAQLVDIHLVCSDPVEHRRRVEGRVADIPGHRLPSWSAVMAHEFEPREDGCLVLDTAILSPGELVERCAAYIGEVCSDGVPEQKAGRVLR